jgi:hypothetical protein
VLSYRHMTSCRCRSDILYMIGSITAKRPPTASSTPKDGRRRRQQSGQACWALRACPNRMVMVRRRYPLTRRPECCCRVEVDGELTTSCRAAWASGAHEGRLTLRCRRAGIRGSSSAPSGAVQRVCKPLRCKQSLADLHRRWRRRLMLTRRELRTREAGKSPSVR